MSAILEALNTNSVVCDILGHSAWYGEISGLKAEKLLRTSKASPYAYLLRKGEKAEKKDESHFYVTFVLPDLSIKHQPFVITFAPNGWYYENLSPGGPYVEESIGDVLHLIMHCNQDQCSPFVKR